MRVSIHTLGTRGDVQPYVALALGLKAAGHEVLVAAPAQFSGLVEGRGIGFVPLPADFLQLLDDADFKASMTRGLGPRAVLGMLKRFKPMMAAMLDAEWAAARPFCPDVVVHHPKALAAPRIARHLGIASILASPLPGFTPTSVFPTPVLPFKSLGPLNRISHVLTARSAELLFGGMLRSWQRRTLVSELSTRPPRRGNPTLYAYSPSVLPVPPEWGSDVLVSGYWFLDDSDWQPSRALAAFLAAGTSPVYVGFGSMPIANPAAVTETVVNALKMCGRRAVLAAGWGGLGGRPLSVDVHLLDSAPHDRLFPLMDVVVHHGGAGTTAAGLRVGKPAVVCPFFGDQSFWAGRVAALGAGPAALPAKRLSADRLAAAILEARRPETRANAESVGARIRADRGVEAAVEFIERQALADACGIVGGTI